MSNIKEIIEKLSKHEISKSEAVTLLQSLFNEQRKAGAIEFEITEVSFSVESNHGYILAKAPYGYSKIENKIKRGDKIDVSIIH